MASQSPGECTPGLPDGISEYPKISISMYSGVPWNEKCWYISWIFGTFTAIWYI
jgi:hypothetical protein